MKAAPLQLSTVRAEMHAEIDRICDVWPLLVIEDHDAKRYRTSVRPEAATSGGGISNPTEAAALGTTPYASWLRSFEHLRHEVRLLDGRGEELRPRRGKPAPTGRARPLCHYCGTAIKEGDGKRGGHDRKLYHRIHCHYMGTATTPVRAEP